MEKEAAAIFEYLFKQNIPETIAAEYSRALGIKRIALDDHDQKIWSKISQKPTLIALVDSYYALTKPQSGIRKKVQLLSAITEATTDYTEHFLPMERSVFYPVKIGLVGIRAVLSFFLGFIYCKIFG